MNTEFIRSFALLYGACIALICAVYVGLGMRKKKLRALEAAQPQEVPEQNFQEQ